MHNTDVHIQASRWTQNQQEAGENSLKWENVKYVVIIPGQEKEWRATSLLLLSCYSLSLLIFVAPSASFFSLTLSKMALTKAEIVSLPIHSFYSTHFLSSHSNPSISEKSPQLLYKTTFFLFLLASLHQCYCSLFSKKSLSQPPPWQGGHVFATHPM